MEKEPAQPPSKKEIKSALEWSGFKDEVLRVIFRQESVFLVSKGNDEQRIEHAVVLLKRHAQEIIMKEDRAKRKPFEGIKQSFGLTDDQAWDLLAEVCAKGIAVPRLSGIKRVNPQTNREEEMVSRYYISPKHSSKGPQIVIVQVNHLGRAVDFYRLDANKLLGEILSRITGIPNEYIKGGYIYNALRKGLQGKDKIWRIVFEFVWQDEKQPYEKLVYLLDIKTSKAYRYLIGNNLTRYVGYVKIEGDEFKDSSKYILTSPFNFQIKEVGTRLVDIITSYPYGNQEVGVTFGAPQDIFLTGSPLTTRILRISAHSGLGKELKRTEWKALAEELSARQRKSAGSSIWA